MALSRAAGQRRNQQKESAIPTLITQAAAKPSEAVVKRQAEARKVAIALARLAAETRCQDVCVLDLRGICGVCDYFVIATGTSARQMKSVAEDMEDLGREQDMSLYRASGIDSSAWIALDFVDVVVHLFGEDARRYYDIEGLWNEARRISWAPRKPAKPKE